jgi:hypothetical protein
MIYCACTRPIEETTSLPLAGRNRAVFISYEGETPDDPP